jgi:hypothetical protein
VATVIVGLPFHEHGTAADGDKLTSGRYKFNDEPTNLVVLLLIDPDGPNGPKRNAHQYHGLYMERRRIFL